MRTALARGLLAAGIVVATLVAARPAAADPLQTFTALLNGGQENPPTSSSAQGLAYMTFNARTNELCYSISYQGLTSAEILAHFHGPAAPGQNAGIVFDISPNGPSPLGSPKVGCVGPLSNRQRRDLRDGLWYINVHSTNFPNGEIRGQVIPHRGVHYRAPAIQFPPPNGSPSGAFVTDLPH